jgi:hypothetical protein
MLLKILQRILSVSVRLERVDRRGMVELLRSTSSVKKRVILASKKINNF